MHTHSVVVPAPREATLQSPERPVSQGGGRTLQEGGGISSKPGTHGNQRRKGEASVSQARRRESRREEAGLAEAGQAFAPRSGFRRRKPGGQAGALVMAQGAPPLPAPSVTLTRTVLGVAAAHTQGHCDVRGRCGMVRSEAEGGFGVWVAEEGLCTRAVPCGETILSQARRPPGLRRLVPDSDLAF